MVRRLVCASALIMLVSATGFAQPSPAPPALAKSGGAKQLRHDQQKEEAAKPKPIPPLEKVNRFKLWPLNSHELNLKKVEALNTAAQRIYILDVSLCRGVEEDRRQLLRAIEAAMERGVEVKILVEHLESREEIELYRKGTIKFHPGLEASLAEYKREMVIVVDGQKLIVSKGWIYKKVSVSTWQIDIREIEELFRKVWEKNDQESL